MKIEILLFFISILVWFCPPFRQRKTEYFLFFLILAVADPINVLINIITSIKTIQVSVIITYALVISLIERNWVKKNSLIIILTLFLLLAAAFTLPIEVIYAIKILLSIIVLFIILKKALLYFNKTQTINLFFLVFILYEITIIIKYIYGASGTKTGIIYFYIISFFEFFIGLFFVLYNKENSPKFKLIKEQTF